MDDLESIADTIRDSFETLSAIRDRAYERSRRLVSICARAIRAVHREEWERAQTLIAEAREAKETLVADVVDTPNLYFAGYTQDAVKEYVEAELTYAIMEYLNEISAQEAANAPASPVKEAAEEPVQIYNPLEN